MSPEQKPIPEPSAQPPNALLQYEATVNPVTDLPGHIGEASRITENLHGYAQQLGMTAIQAGAASYNLSDNRGTSDDKVIYTMVGPLANPDPSIYGQMPFEPRPAADKPLVIDTTSAEGSRESSSPEATLALAKFLGNIASQEKEALPAYEKFVTDHFKPQREASAAAYLKDRRKKKADELPTSTLFSGNAQDLPWLQGTRILSNVEKGDAQTPGDLPANYEEDELPKGYKGRLPDAIAHPARGKSVTPVEQWSPANSARGERPINNSKLRIFSHIPERVAAFLAGDTHTRPHKQVSGKKAKRR